PLTSLPFDVHLMVMNPEWLIPDLVGMGANRISVHSFALCRSERSTSGIYAGFKGPLYPGQNRTSPHA
ncbi:MAG: hypothetical protein RMK32_10410, partial [Anaerolineae bacterium]|nr:hypothetical protein [Anaerolineae bacterium]